MFLEPTQTNQQINDKTKPWTPYSSPFFTTQLPSSSFQTPFINNFIFFISSNSLCTCTSWLRASSVCCWTSSACCCTVTAARFRARGGSHMTAAGEAGIGSSAAALDVATGSSAALACRLTETTAAGGEDVAAWAVTPCSEPFTMQQQQKSVVVMSSSQCSVRPSSSTFSYVSYCLLHIFCTVTTNKHCTIFLGC